MISADNLIFEGNYQLTFGHRKPTEIFELISRQIIDYLQAEGYSLTNNLNSLIYSRPFLVMKFVLAPEHFVVTFKHKVNAKFDKLKANSLAYADWVSNKRLDLPFEIDIHIKLEDHHFSINVISKPLCYNRIARGGLKLKNIDQEKYGFIITENTDIIKRIMTAIQAKEIKPPLARLTKLKFRLSNDLSNLGFTHLADLLDRGYTKINSGQIEDGLSDLRTAFEKVIKECVIMIGQKPEGSINANLEILHKYNYLTNKIFKLLKEVLVDFLWAYLSDIPSHNRDKNYLLNEMEANYAYSIFENSLELLLSKIQKRV